MEELHYMAVRQRQYQQQLEMQQMQTGYIQSGEMYTDPNLECLNNSEPSIDPESGRKFTQNSSLCIQSRNDYSSNLNGGAISI